MADTPFTTFAYPVTGGPTSRTTPVRFGEIVNMKDWDGVGNGSNDDTAAVNAALAQAFGSPAASHGAVAKLNYPLYFPQGDYVVTAPTAGTISGAARATDAGTGFSSEPVGAAITGSISGTTLTVASTVSGTIRTGQQVFGSNVTGGTVIVSGSGSTWTVNYSQTVASTNITLLNLIVIAVNSTSGFVNGQTATISGAVTVPVGAINGSPEIAVIDATHFAYVGSYSANVAFTSYTSGGSLTGAALPMGNIRGAHIFGACRGTSSIRCVNGSLFSSNGLEYSRVELLTLGCPSQTVDGTGSGTNMCVFDMNWGGYGDVHNPPVGGAALQSVTFADLLIGGAEYGIRIGAAGRQGSEVLISNCFFSTNAIAGVTTMNQNAILFTVLGGNFQNCYRGVYGQGGVINTIKGVSFQQQVAVDIEVGNSGTFLDCVEISTCRSEGTANFFKGRLGAPVKIVACGHGGASGHFVDSFGPITVENCNSTAGDIVGGCVLYGTGNRFERTDWLGSDVLAAPALSSGFLGARYNNDLTLNWTSYCAFAGLPAASANIAGALAPVWDSTTATVGNTITGGGSNKVMAFCNGTNWVVK